MVSFYDRTNAEGGTAETEHDKGYIAGVEACMPIAADADALVATLAGLLETEAEDWRHNSYSKVTFASIREWLLSQAVARGREVGA